MAAKRSGKKRSHAKTGKRWSHKVKTVSTFPPESVFTKDAKTIARSLGTKRSVPRGSAPAFA